ncbi:MAG: flavin reductase family protein [Acidobacteria bacterium]|nr:MAG: flavin reductase family protein [Acidobacteriota bacterium]
MRRIRPDELSLQPFTILDREWALLVAGRERPNPMTVSWGGLGTLWNRPVATVYVRPTRFTFSLLEAWPEFTLNVLGDRHRKALDLCGSRSGRDTDKWRETGLAPLPGETVAVPRVAEADLALECRVLATLDLDPQRFLDPAIAKLYPHEDYHGVFLGEVLAAWAADRFVAPSP